jgi:very-short-patch-repair endonuclease
MSDLYIKINSTEVKQYQELPQNIKSILDLKLTNILGYSLDFISKCKSPIETIYALELIDMYQCIYHFYRNNHSSLLIKPQHQINVDNTIVIADFYIESLDNGEMKKLIVECDGHEFHEKTKEQVTKDKERDRKLIKKGYTVVHFTGAEIVKDPTKCVIETLHILGFKSKDK